MNKVNIHIGKKIRALRLKTELTHEELGDLLSLTRASIINMENGRQGSTAKTIYKIACVFNVQVSDLFPPVKKAILAEKSYVVKKIKKRFSPVKI